MRFSYNSVKQYIGRDRNAKSIVYLYLNYGKRGIKVNYKNACNRYEKRFNKLTESAWNKMTRKNWAKELKEMGKRMNKDDV